MQLLMEQEAGLGKQKASFNLKLNTKTTGVSYKGTKRQQDKVATKKQSSNQKCKTQNQKHTKQGLKLDRNRQKR